MTRSIRKSLEYFDHLTESKTSRKGIIYAEELQELMNVAKEQNNIFDFVYIFWKVGYAMGYKCAKNAR